MSRDLILTVVGGALSAAFYLSVSLGSPGAMILANLAQLPLFAVGLGIGLGAATVACAIATAIILAATPPLSAVLFALSGAMPIIVLVHFALQWTSTPEGGREWYPGGYLISWLAALAMSLLVLAGLYFSAGKGGLETAALDYLRAAFGVLGPAIPAEQLDGIVLGVAQYFPAAALGSWLFMVMINGLLAQGVLTRFNRNRRPTAPFAELALPRWPDVMLAACILAAMVPGQIGYVGKNGALIAAMPFFFLGLSVIHAISRRWPGRVFILLLVYVVMLTMRWPAFLVVAIGLAEQLLSLRRRIAAARRDQEEE